MTTNKKTPQKSQKKDWKNSPYWLILFFLSPLLIYGTLMLIVVPLVNWLGWIKGVYAFVFPLGLIGIFVIMQERKRLNIVSIVTGIIVYIVGLNIIPRGFPI